MVDIIDSSYEGLDIANLIPSFFQWIFGNALNFENGSIWGIGLIIVVALVSYLSLKGYRHEKALISSAMITFVVAILSLKAGFISTAIFTIVCIYVVYALYELLSKSSSEEF
jgi:hypothetical protein